MQLKLVLSEKPAISLCIAKVSGDTRGEDGCIEGNGCILSWCVWHPLKTFTACCQSMSYYPTSKLISNEYLNMHKTLCVQPISQTHFRYELTIWLLRWISKALQYCFLYSDCIAISGNIIILCIY